MKENALIEEIRAVRREISAEHGHDTRALVEHYKELEKKYADRMVREARPAGPAKRS